LEEDFMLINGFIKEKKCRILVERTDCQQGRRGAVYCTQ
jgi:hypothetical protein